MFTHQCSFNNYLWRIISLFSRICILPLLKCLRLVPAKLISVKECRSWVELRQNRSNKKIPDNLHQPIVNALLFFFEIKNFFLDPNLSTMAQTMRGLLRITLFSFLFFLIRTLFIRAVSKKRKDWMWLLFYQVTRRLLQFIWSPNSFMIQNVNDEAYFVHFSPKDQINICRHCFKHK